MHARKRWRIVLIGLAVSTAGSLALSAAPATADSSCSGHSQCSTNAGLAPTSGGSGSLGVTLGGTLSAATVIGRAKDWSSQSVPYTGAPGNYDNSPWSFWTDSQVGGPYRQDCSGFVSMAWGLPVDTDTLGLPAYSYELTHDGGQPDPSQLQPGDALIAGGHTVIFNGWYDSAHTRYYAIESTPPNTTGGDNSDIIPYPYWSTNGVPDGAQSGHFGDTYWPYRYDNLTTTPAPVHPVAAVSVGTSGSQDFFYISNGTVKYRTADSNGNWLGIADVPNAPSGVTSIAAVPVGTAGNFDLFFDAGGTVKYVTGTGGGGWLGLASVGASPAGVTSIAAVPVGTAGSFDLFFDAGGAVKYVTGTGGGGWLGLASVGASPAGVTSIAAVPVGTAGNFDLFFGVGGAVKYVTGTGSGGWLGLADLPNSPSGVDAMTAAPLGTSGSFDVYFDENGTVQYMTGSGSGGFLGLATLSTS